MNYEKMTDFEINLAVAKVHVDYESLHELPMMGGSIRWSDGASWHHFNPCNSWADAGPIIVQSRIGLEPAMKGERWVAQNGYFKTAEAHINPLRAAMIVFLMMKEDKCSN